MKYCSLCQRYVEPQKKFSWPLFLLGLLLVGVGAVVYLIYYFIFAGKVYCPICKGKQLAKYSPADVEARQIEKLEKKETRKEKLDEIKNKVMG